VETSKNGRIRLCHGSRRWRKCRWHAWPHEQIAQTNGLEEYGRHWSSIWYHFCCWNINQTGITITISFSFPFFAFLPILPLPSSSRSAELNSFIFESSRFQFHIHSSLYSDPFPYQLAPAYFQIPASHCNMTSSLKRLIPVLASTVLKGPSSFNCYAYQSMYTKRRQSASNKPVVS